MSTYNQLHQVKKATADTKQQRSPTRLHLTKHTHPASIIQRTQAAPESLSAADALQLQCTIGNQDVGQLMSEIGRISSSPAQRQGPEEEEELLQGKFTSDCIQCQAPEKEELVQGKFSSWLTGTLQAKEEASPNMTSMPDHLKSGLENISGMDLSGVRVHYNSSKPKQINALAYTQGQEIHVGPGQEKHLPHEGWHVVQQMQGRVKPTMQMTGVSINDDAGLEKEADVMGNKAAQMHLQMEMPKENKSRSVANTVNQNKSNDKQGFGFVNNRPEVIAQKEIQLESISLNENLDVRMNDYAQKLTSTSNKKVLESYVGRNKASKEIVQLLQSDGLAGYRLENKFKEVTITDLVESEILEEIIEKLTAYDKFEWEELSFVAYLKKEQQIPYLRKTYSYLQEIEELAANFISKNNSSLIKEVKDVVTECSNVKDAVIEDIKNLEKGEYHPGLEKMPTPSSEIRELAQYAYDNKTIIWNNEVQTGSGSTRVMTKIANLTDSDEQVKYIKKEIYGEYSRFPEGRAIDSSLYEGFIRNLKVVEDEGDSGKKFYVYPQNRGFRGRTSSNLSKIDAMNKIVDIYYISFKDKLDNMFAYRVMAGSDVIGGKNSGDTESRITLRLNPTKSTEVFKVIATDIVGSDSTDFAEVEQAKIMGPAKIGTSSDSLVIYVKSTDKAVISRIVTYLTSKFNEDFFVEGGPKTMLKLPSKGFSYAERAEESGSHGTSRCLPIARAFVEMMKTMPTAKFEEFMMIVNAKMGLVNIDTNKAWKNA